jgi:hypothetical protein
MRRSVAGAGSEALNQIVAKTLLSFSLGVLVMLEGSLIYSKVHDFRLSPKAGKSRHLQPALNLQPAPIMKNVGMSIPDVNTSGDERREADQQNRSTDTSPPLPDFPDSNKSVPASPLTSTNEEKRAGGVTELSHIGRERIEAGGGGSVNRWSSINPTPASRSASRVNTSEPGQSEPPPSMLPVSSGPDSATAQQMPYTATPVQVQSVPSPGTSPAVLPQTHQETISPEGPKMITIQPGTPVEIRLTESLSSDHNRTGDTFRATLASPVVVNGFVVAQADSVVLGRVFEARRAPLVGGNSDLTLGLTNITLNEGSLAKVDSSLFEQHGSRSNMLNTVKMATGAAVGAAIGAITGAAEGAGLTSAMRNGDRTNGFMATKRTVVLPAGTRIAFTLRTPLTIPQHG